MSSAITAAPPQRHAGTVDPVTYEVIRHRLMAIVEQQSVVLKSVSGSPIVTDANDCNTGIYLPDGEIAVMGPHIIFHAGSMGLVVSHIINDCEADPGIEEGDAFITSDPYKGALHLPDVTMLEPVFWEGERIAWVGACAHELDVGGMNHSSWCPTATEAIQEGLIIPPTKLVSQGKIRSDVWRLIMAGTRLPANVGLDLKAMLAANNHGKRGLIRLIERYGAETVISVMGSMLDRTEERVRERIRALPDGIFRARNYLDHDGHANKLYSVEVEMTKSDDKLRFDYSKSSEQAPGFVNCTEAGLRGGVMSSVLTLLAYDMPWNSGAMRAIEVIAPEGLIVNAKRPAPCSSATLSGTWMVENTACEAVSRLLSADDDLRSEAQSGGTGACGILHLAGLNQYGEGFGGALTETMLGGGGATNWRKGNDYGGPRNILTFQVPNIESDEELYPILYLGRFAKTDSTGSGRLHGGISGGSTWTVHDAHFLAAVLAAHGLEMPTTLGMHGGAPGSCHQFTVVRGSDVADKLANSVGVYRADDFEGDKTVLGAKPGEIAFMPGDVFEWSWHGGGGWGDALEADAEQIALDVAHGYMTTATAERYYGVCVVDGAVDSKATEQARKKTRDARKKWKSAAKREVLSDLKTTPVANLGEHLSIVSAKGKHYTACDCGHVLAPANENWKHYAGHSEYEAEDLGPKIVLHEALHARAYACQACGVMLSIDVIRHEDEPLHDVELLTGGGVLP